MADSTITNSGIVPHFITGANARIKIGAKVLAYCTDVSYNVNVATVPVEAMGKYEVYANEPVAYTVDGTFSVIRYTAEALKNAGDTAAPGDSPTQIGVSNHLNPAQLLGSGTFNLEIYEAHAVINTATSVLNSVFKIGDCRITRRGATLNKRGVLVDNYAFVGILAGDGTDLVPVGPSSPTAPTGSTVV